jgi:hypothetical protein
VTGRQWVPADRRRHPVATVVGRVAGGLVTVLVLGSIGYLVPLTAAPEAVAAMAGEGDVRVESRLSRDRRAEEVVAATPGVTRWAVGGHSLGGVAAGVAVSSRDSGLSGLLLWASYPLGSLADRSARRRLDLGYR